MPRRTILVVGDEMAIGRKLEASLTRLGYATAGIATSGRDAIALAQQTHPDLVLIDLELGGGMNGMEAAEEIRRRRPVPIVFLTAYPDNATLRLADLTGPFGYVIKPIGERDLHLNLEMAFYKSEAQSNAREFEDRFFDVSIDLLCFLDFGGYFKRLNPAWERTLGFTREELQSKPFIEFVHPDDRARTLEQNRKVRAGGQALGFDNRYLCKDGSYRWLRWNAAPDFGQRVIYSVARDITEMKHAEEVREKLVQELQAALAEVEKLQDILPICSYCKKIRNDEHYWESVDTYLAEHTNTRFSHGICPACYETEVEPLFDPPKPK
jgi:PAS domain S-box-containing protein